MSDFDPHFSDDCLHTLFLLVDDHPHITQCHNQSKEEQGKDHVDPRWYPNREDYVPVIMSNQCLCSGLYKLPVLR